MNSLKTRMLVVAAAMAAIAASLGACAGQPNAGCPVATSNPAVLLPPFWVKYTPVATTACSDLTGEGIGFQKYNAPGSEETRLAYRVESLGTAYAKKRRDPSDPEGKNLNGFSKLPAFPDKDNYCAATDFMPAQQTFAEIPAMPKPDGGMVPAVPELALKYEFKNLKFLATVNAPGTVFTGELTRTENGCSASFKTLGLWPQIPCDSAGNDMTKNGYNLECDPYPKEDAGHLLGSGINPTFSPEAKPLTCGAEGWCELQLTIEEVAKL
jgi:hypothetical protein